ncbi:hypothetical protein D3C72_1334140 [compost metagenome]
MDEDVGAGRQGLEGGHALFALQVDGDRALAAVEDVEVERVAVAKRRAHVARVVAALDALELHDVGAEVRQDRAREGPRQHLSELEHPDAFQNFGVHVTGARGPLVSVVSNAPVSASRIDL